MPSIHRRAGARCLGKQPLFIAIIILDTEINHVGKILQVGHEATGYHRSFSGIKGSANEVNHSHPSRRNRAVISNPPLFHTSSRRGPG